MTRTLDKPALAVAAGLLVMAALPLLLRNDYLLSFGINLLQFATLATAWALFSGPTRYISLATTAFYGIGAYTVAVLGELLPWPLVLATALGIGSLIALGVGLATLRLSGVYFVIFTFGLAELVKQLVTWFEVNISKSSGRYVFLDIPQQAIYWQLLALLALALATGWLIRRSRLGLALRVIGEDETAARHLGIDTTRTKVLLFVLSAGFMSLTGAVIAPRWTYIDPGIVFNANVSFQVLIMALLGGAGHWLGPLAGVVPLVLLFELLSVNFPNYFAVLLGATFLAIVFLVPGGIVALAGRWPQRWRRPAATPSLKESRP
ncbi:branched-chain amino acid ABC transporter permease [Aquincola sp. S2]|uniref:Branched-chain amino acid ABC transporter permease n=1 Tax=Pseudaquabacterium terrae TaxID=2732868 RepID=A0ABX2EGI8_9BURK|nr:branched-chain amino acid ABC transporter permease [Aquabacterium terrae]NRF67716.1 branched-chain amino acid ABC transporter permease [Aquabacterium terrae]